MKRLSVPLSGLLLLLVPSITFGALLTPDAPSPLTGYVESGRYEYANDQNLASVANGFALPAVALDLLPGYAIHQPHFVNDGFYGNPSSWIGNSAQSWVKIDLGRVVNVSSLRFGRDRIGIYDDRDPGTIKIEVATVDNVYANGDASNDGAEYIVVLPPTLLVDMGSMSATSTSAGVLVAWTTVTEVDTVGFRLLRKMPGTAEKALRVVAPMIPAAGHGLSGATYEFLDNTVRPGTGARYFIEDIDIFGKATRHGPIEIRRGARAKPRQHKN